MSNPRAPDETLQKSVTRTGQNYDSVPYVSTPFPRLQPARLAGVARLLGLVTPDVTRARTLEIGCAAGGHLIPLAATCPNAGFVGVDVSAAQIADGQARIARLGLENIALHACSVTDIDATWGQFDYIICHGVYSWVPDAIREAIMRTCSERLSRDGVAVISFNVLPGWRMFQIVRDSLILHAGDETDYKTRSARTRKMFELMAKIAPEKGSYGAIWRYEARAMADRPDFYLAHEIFEEDNAPCTFRSFAETAALHGLAYLAETRLNANIPESGPPETAKAIRELAGDDQIAAEQYIDVIRGTTFRESLLIPAARAPQIHRALDGERLATLHFIAPLDLRVAAPADAGELVLENDDGHVIATKDPCLSAALRMLVDNTPRSSSFSELAAANAATPEQRSKLTALFMHLLVQGALEISCEPVLCAVRPGDIPAAWPLVISDAAAGAEHSATLRHAPFPVTPIVRFLMPMLDGRHSRAEMTQALVRLAQSGELTIANDKGPITDVEQLSGVCAAKVDREIAQLARIGVLLDA